MKQEQDAEPVALLKRPDSSPLADRLDGADSSAACSACAQPEGSKRAGRRSGGRRLGSRSQPKIHNPMKAASRKNATIASIASGMNIHRATSHQTP